MSENPQACLRDKRHPFREQGLLGDGKSPNNSMPASPTEDINPQVHLFTLAQPNDLLATLIQKIKSITSRGAFYRFPNLKRILWSGGFWERGYFVMSSGTGTTDEMICQYIKDHSNLFRWRSHQVCSDV